MSKESLKKLYILIHQLAFIVRDINIRNILCEITYVLEKEIDQ